MWQLPQTVAPGYGAAPHGAAMPVPAPPPAMAMPAEQVERVPLGKRVEVHIDKLLDMPRAYLYRRPKSYRVKIFEEGAEDLELACSDVIDGFQGWTPGDDDIDNIDVEPSKGVLSLNTTANLFFVQVEYSGGESDEFIGRCHIHRMDPRSVQSWPYMLSNMAGESVNCGIHLWLVEVDGVVPRQRAPRPEEVQMHGPPHPGQQQGQPQSGLPPQGYFHTEGMPPQLPGHTGVPGPSQAQLEAMYYGHAEGPPPGYGVPGFADHSTMFGTPNLLGMFHQPGASSGQPYKQPVQAHRGAAIPAAGSSVTYTYTYDVPPAPVTHAAPVASSRDDYNRVYELPPLAANMHLYDAYDPRSSDIVGHTEPEYVDHDDSLTESWAKKPKWSITGEYGSEYDLKFKASLSEAWDRPLEPFDSPLFVDEKTEFPDMDLSLVNRAKGARNQSVRTDHKHVAGRASAGLPEFSFDKYVPYKPPMDLDPWHVPNTQPQQKHTEPKIGNLASGKVRAERSLVPADFKDLTRSDKELTQLDPSLVLRNFEVQAIGQLDTKHEKHRQEKHVWVRTPRECGSADWADQERWLRQFGTEELTIAMSCQRGKRGQDDPIPNQDNFSITKVGPDTVLYVVCDGHGPYGHLCAFRVAQSLPKLLFEELQSRPDVVPEHALISSFHDANEDLKIFASTKRINIWASGTTCAAVLRIGGDVQVAWLGDCGAVVGSVDGRGEQVDFMTPLHTTDSPSELARVKAEGAAIHQVSPHNAPRIFKHGSNGPGLFATRVLGDSLVSEHGVSAEPDLKKTSFHSEPGVMLLATGGVFGIIPNPEAVLSLLAKGRMMHGETWHRQSLSVLGGMAQKLWAKEEKQHEVCDDITCILLHWNRPAPRAPGQDGSRQATLRQQISDEPRQAAPRQHMSAPRMSDQLGKTSFARSSVRHNDDAEAPVFNNAQPPAVTTGLKSKPTTTYPHLSQRDVEELCSQAHLVQPDPALGHPDILAQVVTCVEARQQVGVDKPVWFSEKGEPTSVRLEHAQKGWLAKFQDANIQVATICRKGQTRADPNQDSYSITSATGNRGLYVVCDGHGPLGHIASFRVTQSLPMLVLQGMSEMKTGQPPELVLTQAIKEASIDLQNFGQRNELDFSCSGASCSVALRIADRVFVGWVGDSRALVATVVGQRKKVDLMSEPHLVSNAAEYNRLCEASLSVAASPEDVARVYEPGKNVPGLSISRALGDFSVGAGSNAQGVISEAGLTKTSFAGVPGLVLLASGGMCEHIDDRSPGEDILDTLTGQGDLLESGPDHALKALCSTSQERWQAKCRDYSEDVSAIIIHWVGPGSTASTPMRTSQGASPDSASSAPTRTAQGASLQPRVVRSAEVSRLADPARSEQLFAAEQRAAGQRTAAALLGNAPLQGGAVPPLQVYDAAPRTAQPASPVRDASALAARTLPASSSGSLPASSSGSPDSSAAAASGEPRKFLQAQPRAGRAATLPVQKAKVSLQLPAEEPDPNAPEPRPRTRNRYSVAQEGATVVPAASTRGVTADKLAAVSTDVAPSRLMPVRE